MATKTTPKTKKPTPLSTHALAAFMTWKQFDLLLLLRNEGPSVTGPLSENLEEIKKYDVRHGGAFYNSTSWDSTYSSLSTLLRRRLVDKWINDQTGYVEWGITDRGRKALEGLE
jgi:hypothetical protein